jgi:hypothetical protein
VERTLQLAEENVAIWIASQVLLEEVAGSWPIGGTESGSPVSVGDGVGNSNSIVGADNAFAGTWNL